MTGRSPRAAVLLLGHKSSYKFERTGLHTQTHTHTRALFLIGFYSSAHRMVHSGSSAASGLFGAAWGSSTRCSNRVSPKIIRKADSVRLKATCRENQMKYTQTEREEHFVAVAVDSLI